MSQRSRPHYRQLLKALLPLCFTMLLLGGNTYFFAGKAGDGPNQIALLLGGFLAWLLHRNQKLTPTTIGKALHQNFRPILPTFWFLVVVAIMSVTWLVSGITPAIIYYGLHFLNPRFFLVMAALLCAIVSVVTGSSWATIATLGVALLQIGKALGWSSGMVAGAVISGAYFGDKISPLSETTVMAASITQTTLFGHIKAMLWTSLPTFGVTLGTFMLIGLFKGGAATTEMAQSQTIIAYLGKHFTITPWLFAIPLIVFGLILLRIPPVTTLCIGALLGCLAFFLLQPPLLVNVWGPHPLLSLKGASALILGALKGVSLAPDHPLMGDLLSSGGIVGMIPTMTLMLSAIVMGGLLEVTGVIHTITSFLMGIQSIGGLILVTTLTGILLNLTVADQYLAILLGGKIYSSLFKTRGLESSNLSRTLEDSITVTSVLIPWNTCGAAQATVLGVSTFVYAPYAFFCLLTPLVGVLLAYMGIGIKKIPPKKKA